MGIIYQTDKRSGLTYAYENKAYWDKEKRQSRSKRKLVGRVDPGTGEIVPTDGRNRKRGAEKEGSEHAEYKERYEELAKKYAAAETLIEALQKEIRQLKGCRG